MDGKGRATDNTCIERFWRSAKCERIYLNEYQSIGELITDVGPKMSWKNTQQNSFADSLVIEHKSLSEIYISPKPLTTF
jgi:hypothetical protein